MAHYIKFEILLPTEYTIQGIRKPVSVDREEIRSFSERLVEKFGGATESNPTTAPPYLGYWKKKKIEVDRLTFIFVLVSQRYEHEAIKFFKQWKVRFEKKYNQQFVLITHYPIQIIGGL